MFGFGWHEMLEAMKSSFDVAGHGNVAGLCVVIPLERQPAVGRSGPISADLVRCLQDGDEKVGVGAGIVSDAEIVNDKAEDDAFGVVSPKARCERNGAPCWAKNWMSWSLARRPA